LSTAILRTGAAKQAVRLRRLLLATAAYGVCVPLLALAHLLHLIAFAPTVTAIAAMVAVNAAIYALFRSRLNERFADPSLTWLQTMSGVAILMYVVYNFDRERGLAVMMCLVVLSFGTFRFTRREFLTAAGIVLAAYAAVINLLMWTKPDAINVPLEAFQWVPSPSCCRASRRWATGSRSCASGCAAPTTSSPPPWR